MSEQLYYRDGREFSGVPQRDEKNKPFLTYVPSCNRCGGAGGSDKWAHTGWTCYQCGGTGKAAPKIARLYTRAQIDKLNAAADKRAAKKEAERQRLQAAIEADRAARRAQYQIDNAAIITLGESLADEFISNMLAECLKRAAISPAQCELIHKKVAENARRAAAKHVGAIGERRAFKCHMVTFRDFDGRFGKTFLHIMRDENGNTIKYMGSHILGGVKVEGTYGDRWYSVVPDELIEFTATVTAHESYNSEPQTIVKRPKQD